MDDTSDTAWRPFVYCLLNADPPRVVIGGEIDLLAQDLLDAARLQLESVPARDVVLDMRAVTVFSCVGLTFIALLRERHHAVYVLEPPRLVRRTLELTGMDSVVEYIREADSGQADDCDADPPPASLASDESPSAGTSAEGSGAG